MRRLHFTLSSIPIRRATRLVCLVVSLLSLTGCGQAHARPTTSSDPPPRSPADRAELQVVYWPRGQGATQMRTWSLRCHPLGGDHPRRSAACREIARSPQALGRAKHACLTRTPPRSPAAMITGTFRDRTVDRLYRPGCDDWQTLHIVLTGR